MTFRNPARQLIRRPVLSPQVSDYHAGDANQAPVTYATDPSGYVWLTGLLVSNGLLRGDPLTQASFPLPLPRSGLRQTLRVAYLTAAIAPAVLLVDLTATGQLVVSSAATNPQPGPAALIVLDGAGYLGT